MNILFITQELGIHNGWSRYSLDVVQGLISKGHQVNVLCRNRNDTIKHVVQIPVMYDALRFVGPLLCLPKIIYHAFRGGWSMYREVTVIHCAVETYAPTAYVLSRILRVPFIVTLHGSFALKTLIHPILRHIQVFCYSRAKRLIAVSNYTLERVSLYVHPRNISVIPNGVSQDLLGLGARSLSEDRAPLILSVGALKSRKGLIESTRIIAQVMRNLPDYTYCIIGHDSRDAYARELRRFIADTGLQERILIKSDISDEERNDLYARASLFVLTPISSTFDFEGFGLVYLEANSFGIPSVGSYGNGGEDAIMDGRTGLLVDTNADPSNAARRIELVLRDRELWQKYSRSAREWAEAHSWDKVLDRYISVYHDAETIFS